MRSDNSQVSFDGNEDSVDDSTFGARHSVLAQPAKKQAKRVFVCLLILAVVLVITPKSHRVYTLNERLQNYSRVYRENEDAAEHRAMREILQKNGLNPISATLRSWWTTPVELPENLQDDFHKLAATYQKQLTQKSCSSAKGFCATDAELTKFQKEHNGMMPDMLDNAPAGDSQTRPVEQDW